MQQRYANGKQIANAFQTTGVLINDEEGGLAALPGEGDDGSVLRLNVLADIGLEDRGLHGPAGVQGGRFRRGAGVLRVERFFLEIEAVFAIEIADGPDGLGHDVKAGEAHRV